MHRLNIFTGHVVSWHEGDTIMVGFKCEKCGIIADAHKAGIGQHQNEMEGSMSVNDLVKKAATRAGVSIAQAKDVTDEVLLELAQMPLQDVKKLLRKFRVKE